MYHPSRRKVRVGSGMRRRYAVMVENNRVMRFDCIDPNSKYVAHVKYPHPVEDMFVFYSSLNADPVIYLNPKIPAESEQ